jgi:membrane protease YdiL (CAAX protease family)
MKRGSTLFLKLALFLIGTPVLALGVFGLYWLVKNPANPDYAHMLYPIVVGFYLSAIPFFAALYQAFKLLSYIDKNEAFSQISVKALKNIKFCAMTFSGLYVVILPFVYMVAELDDAPGLIIIGMVPIFASMVIAVFAAVLQRLLQEAIDIKSENDLTV